MLEKIMTRIFGSKKDKDWKDLEPLVEQIKKQAEEYFDLSDEDIPRKTEQFRQRIQEGETLDDLLIPAFALVKVACKKLTGRSWTVTGNEQTWDMVPFDVQIAGGIVLHQGKIAEMATGEGKTLVATMPLYLNSLSGKGAHLVTVNDYLALRDSEWMGELYRFLGLTVGCIQSNMTPAERREQYGCDITYGTNSEFGFDYLRDNMALRKEELVQRNYNFAIVDEVDSVLIDEARTPLIISGPVQRTTSTKFEEFNQPVKNLFQTQRKLVIQLLDEAEKIPLDSDEEKSWEKGELLLKVKRGDPKNKRFLKLMTDAQIRKLVDQVENTHIRDKNMHELDEDLYFVIDEKSNVIDLTEKGRMQLSGGNPERFVIPDLVEQIQQLEARDDISPEEKAELKEEIYRENEEKSEIIHSINQLVKAYSLFEKDVAYVVMEGKVLIVDEYTGRLMPGRRFSEGLHQALEAKEGVKVGEENQTLATITIQNYFRMYEKLSGMTGTAETEAAEFKEIYKLDVAVIPTNRPVRRVDFDDAIFMTKKEKMKSIVDEIERLYNNKLPVLVGTVSVDVSEVLSRYLKRRGITHNVLNAKYHQREAEIVKDAGQPGAVTIATNMAGRGTDIKLGKGVVQCQKCCINCYDNCEECSKEQKLKECKNDVPCGLHIIGTERHESRRIDRQLRGRSGRQGDPGASRFFLSLEDDLMRLFGSDRLTNVLAKVGFKEGEEIKHPWISRAIEKAQAKVEGMHFESRKYTLKFDDVINKHREVVYGYRRQALEKDRLKEIILEMIDDFIFESLDEFKKEKGGFELYSLKNWLTNFISHIDLENIENEAPAEDNALVDYLIEKIEEAYNVREEVLGEMIEPVERFVVLTNIDRFWQDHLRFVDTLREGVGLRAYGQRDPVNEFKAEAYKTFQELMTNIRRKVFRDFFRLQLVRKPEPQAQRRRWQYGSAGGGEKPTVTQRRVEKVGRNDPCPCGSGKKYKKCCGKKQPSGEETT